MQRTTGPRGLLWLKEKIGPKRFPEGYGSFRLFNKDEVVGSELFSDAVPLALSFQASLTGDLLPSSNVWEDAHWRHSSLNLQAVRNPHAGAEHSG